ncbi:MAG: PAS domain S-box protein [Chroococcidiopsidaceae cyanobacterium CP_BM_ER_R8_30]|nr:PAS domain S-box protein [Chroococcidiopsidaceae cyanobacterium CP_BM_ER_R8_30]
MNHHLSQHLDSLHRHLTRLQLYANELPRPQSDLQLTTLVEKLYTVLEELQVSFEEFYAASEQTQVVEEALHTTWAELQMFKEEVRQQNAELATAYQELSLLYQRYLNPCVLVPNGGYLTTNTKRMDLALRGSRHLLEAVIEGTTDAIFAKDLQGRYIIANSTAAQMLGKLPKEVIGKDDIELVSAEQAKQLREIDLRILTTKQTEIVKESLTVASVARTYLSMKGPCQDSQGNVIGLIGIMRDITEREQVEAILLTHQRFIQRIVETTPDILYVHDLIAQRNIYTSPQIAQILGYTQQQIRAMGEAILPTLAHPDDLARIQEHIKHFATAAEGEVVETEYRMRHANGEWRWFHSRNTLFAKRADGLPVQVLGTAQDITEQKQAEEKLKAHTHQQAAVAQLSQLALANADPTTVMNQAVALVAQTLEVEYSKVLELLSDGNNLLLRAGVGWQEGLVGRATVGAMIDSQAGYTLLSHQPVVVEDLRKETRFSGPPLLHDHNVASGMSVIIHGQNRPFGVLGAHTTRLRTFTQDDIHFLQVIANVLATAIERKWNEQKISEQAALLDISTDAIAVRDLTHHILFWNSSAEKLYGWKAGEVLGKNTSELLYKYSPELEEALDIVVKKGEWWGELRQVTKLGKEIIVNSRWTLMRDEQGQPKSILTVDTDMTEKKQLEAQLLRTQRLESLGTLASGIVHDLNNVLAPLLMSVELLEMELPDEYSQRLKTMEANIKRGAALVKQVLSFVRGVEGERTILQVRHLILEIEQIIKQTFPKSIEVCRNISPDLWTVSGNATQLHQVLMNLVVNARDAMPDGGTLSIYAENLFIDAHYAQMHLEADVGAYIVIIVSDTGTGIPPEILERIFEPFFTTKKAELGTGLGLSTVTGILKSHRGFVSVTSEVGKGSQFQVYLPAVEGTQKQQVEAVELSKGNKELILVVDDETSIREITKTALLTHNYKVLTAEDGIEAIALYAQHKDEIIVVLMDLMMPSLDGVITIRTLQKMNPLIKVIAISGFMSNQKIAEVASMGVKAFLSKPCTAKELLQTIDGVLRAPSI